MFFSCTNHLNLFTIFLGFQWTLRQWWFFWMRIRLLYFRISVIHSGSARFGDYYQLQYTRHYRSIIKNSQRTDESHKIGQHLLFQLQPTGNGFSIFRTSNRLKHKLYQNSTEFTEAAHASFVMLRTFLIAMSSNDGQCVGHLMCRGGREAALLGPVGRTIADLTR